MKEFVSRVQLRARDKERTGKGGIRIEGQGQGGTQVDAKAKEEGNRQKAKPAIAKQGVAVSCAYPSSYILYRTDQPDGLTASRADHKILYFPRHDPPSLPILVRASLGTLGEGQDREESWPTREQTRRDVMKKKLRMLQLVVSGKYTMQSDCYSI